jgi:hypothetical protein
VSSDGNDAHVADSRLSTRVSTITQAYVQGHFAVWSIIDCGTWSCSNACPSNSILAYQASGLASGSRLTIALSISWQFWKFSSKRLPVTASASTCERYHAPLLTHLQGLYFSACLSAEWSARLACAGQSLSLQACTLSIGRTVVGWKPPLVQTG